MGTGRHSVPGTPSERLARRRKRRRQTSERATQIPKSTLSEIFDPGDAEPEEELEVIEVEPESAPPKRAPWWSVHPVPPPPRRASTSPPPLRRPQHALEVPPLDSLETPLSLAPPPVFDSPSTDAPLVSSSEAPRERERGRSSMRVAAALFVLGAGVVFGLSLGRAPEASSATSEPADEPRPASRPIVRATPGAPTLPARSPSVEPDASRGAALSLDDEPASATGALPLSLTAAENSAAAEAKPAPTAPHGLKSKSKTGTASPFDSTGAAIAMNEAARRAASCRAPSDPTGAAMVMIKFAPSGRVTTSVIEGGPFAGTTIGGCIALAFRGARVPPFSGEPVTLRKTVTYP